MGARICVLLSGRGGHLQPALAVGATSGRVRTNERASERATLGDQFGWGKAAAASGLLAGSGRQLCVFWGSFELALIF